MCDIRAFGKEIMDLPDETDIQRKDEESECDVESVRNSPKSCKTFQAPDFGSDLDLKECSYSENEAAGFDFHEFQSNLDTESPLFSESPERKGYEHDSDFEPEKEVEHERESDFDSEKVVKVNKRKNNPVVQWNGKRFKRMYSVESFIDFTQGQTRVNKKLLETDPRIMDAVELCLTDKQAYARVDGVFYKPARNWGGIFLPGLVVNDKGHFYVMSEGKGIFKKPVSQKDRFIYHDSMRILAPRIVFCTFSKHHPGLLGESEDDYIFVTRNKNKHNVGIDNLICTKKA